MSTGLADLDRLLGGGLPLGCLLLVLEDSPPEAALALLRYFLAEGVAAGHACRWAAPSTLPDDQLWLPQPSVQQPGQQPKHGSAAAVAAGDQQQPEQSSAASHRPGPQQGPQQHNEQGQNEGRPQQADHLRIAWQYRRYMGGRADAAHAPHPGQGHHTTGCV